MTVPSDGAAAAPPSWWARCKAAAKRLKREVLALHYAIQDPRVGWLPRLVALLALAYALSPVDLIPDFIPVLGLVDDLLVLPGLLLLARRLIPADVMEAGRQRAEREPLRLHKNWGMALLFFAMWDALLLALVWWSCQHYGSPSVQRYQIWIVVGCGLVALLAQLAWVIAAHRKDARLAAALTVAGVCDQRQPELQEALLSGGSAAVREYLEP
ncbi:PF06803 family [Chlorella sorokiniana]|uniref:PF06803 family n=1 Tax=Chlorella sorokiniana TaxID=3076 RepID=A0A2P6TB72_CHLSO|nr:PF06803 family [Chlorella sorokiniana]|eukprot:PRW05805.1 PF06803 family [Chlorella sorokiniana]